MMKKLCIAFFVSSMIIPWSSAQCYELVWADEFNYTGQPDPAKWKFETGDGKNFGNNELQYYLADDPDNSWVDSGRLVITALKENYGNNAYTSARINTAGKFSFQYGRIESSIRLPYGQGIWPAFWMLGNSIGQIGWPACGEIDIMELIGGGDGRDNTVHGTAHWANAQGAHASYGKSTDLDEGIFADTFHLFAVEWTPDKIRWYLDGVNYVTLDITPSDLNEFRDEFFIILNLAVGGNWPGSPDETTVFPQSLYVDYVRVYQSGNQLNMTGDSTVATRQSDLVYSLPYHDDWTYDWSVPDDAEIISGQGTEAITINWGCSDGTIRCNVTGTCDTYEVTREISTESRIEGPMFVDAGQKNVLFTVPAMSGTTYAWSFPQGVTVTSGAGTDSVLADWGVAFGEVTVETDNTCGTMQSSVTVRETGQYPYPSPGEPHEIPGVIQSVEYDYGGEGIAYHDLSAGNEGSGLRQDEGVDTEDRDGPNIGWISAGEWIEYSVRVDTSRYYSVELRVASDNAAGGGPISIGFNGREALGGISVPSTGGWGNFVTLNAGKAFLEDTDTLMRLNFTNGGFNLGKITFVPASPLGLPSVRQAHKVTLYPNPVLDVASLESKEDILSVRLYDITGKLLKDMNGLNMEFIDVNVCNLDPGLYFCRVRFADRSEDTLMMIKHD